MLDFNFFFIVDKKKQMLLPLLLWGPLSLYLWTRWSFARCGGGSHLLFLLCETVVLLVGCINTHVLVEGTLRYEKQQKEMEHVEWSEVEEMGEIPHVLVILPTYHEGVGVLEKTLDAVERLDYPRQRLTVVVGDDGKDDHVQEFVQTRYPSFFYHRRMLIQGHAKAGNVNDILFASEDTTQDFLHHLLYPGDYVLLLDCDMIPEPDILNQLLPLFWEKSSTSGALEKKDHCAFVQSPQAFYNIDGKDWLGQHYLFFYHVVLKAYSGFSLGVPCCGTNVVFHREALLVIGGFQYGSVTEDFNTSLLLHSQGWVSKYSTGKTAVGMAPLSLVEFYHQRKRWSTGGLQIVFSSHYWERVRRLPLVYQWIYTFSGASPFLALFLLVLMLGPVVDLFLSPHDTTTTTFLCSLSTTRYLTFFLPYAAVYMGCLFYLHRHLSWRVVITSMQETLFMVFLSLRFIASFVRKKLGFRTFTFKITKKTLDHDDAPKERLSTFFILLPFLLYDASAVAAMIRRFLIQRDGAFYVDSIWICLILAQIAPVLFYVVQERWGP